MGKPKRILVVEDEFITALDIETSLKKMGHTVVNKISTGKKAIMKLDIEKPDLLLLDIMLKDDISGIQVAVEAKKRKIPFVFITALSNIHQYSALDELAPLDIIIKPVDQVKLKNSLSKIL